MRGLTCLTTTMRVLRLQALLRSFTGCCKVLHWHVRLYCHLWWLLGTLGRQRLHGTTTTYALTWLKRVQRLLWGIATVVAVGVPTSWGRLGSGWNSWRAGDDSITSPTHRSFSHLELVTRPRLHVPIGARGVVSRRPIVPSRQKLAHVVSRGWARKEWLRELLGDCSTVG